MLTVYINLECRYPRSFFNASIAVLCSVQVDFKIVILVVVNALQILCNCPETFMFHVVTGTLSLVTVRYMKLLCTNLVVSFFAVSWCLFSLVQYTR